jgi:hypothetical protein
MGELVLRFMYGATMDPPAQYVNKVIDGAIKAGRCVTITC